MAWAIDMGATQRLGAQRPLQAEHRSCMRTYTPDRVQRTRTFVPRDALERREVPPPFQGAQPMPSQLSP